MRPAGWVSSVLHDLLVLVVVGFGVVGCHEEQKDEDLEGLEGDNGPSRMGKWSWLSVLQMFGIWFAHRRAVCVISI
jgi:hypothetical protein